MNRDLKKIISQMTLEEKAGMCSGLAMVLTGFVSRMTRAIILE